MSGAMFSQILSLRFAPRECRSYQRLNVRTDLRCVPIRGFGIPACLQRYTGDREAARRVTTIVNRYRRDGVQ